MLPRYTINLSDTASPLVGKLMATVGDNKRLAGYAGRKVQQRVGEHMLGVAQTRHATAQRLGGSPTGFFGDAYEAVTAPDALAVEPGRIRLKLRHPGFARAFGEVTIRPTGGREHLTLPIAGESYGKSIFQGDSPRFAGGFFFRSKKGNLLYAIRLGKGKSAPLKLLYYLPTEVTQKQDESILPTGEQLTQAALEGAVEYIDAKLAEKGQS